MTPLCVTLLRVVAILTTTVLSASVAVADYFGSPVELRIFDKESGQPLSGVAAVISYRGVAIALWKGTPYKYFQVAETTSDSQGIVRFGGWGPVSFPGYVFTSEAPSILLFKAGYRPENVADISMEPQLSVLQLRSSPIVKMERAPTEIRQLAGNINGMNAGLGSILESGGKCEWERIAGMLDEMAKIDSQFTAAGLPIHSLGYAIALRQEYSEKRGKKDGCASASKYLRGGEKK